MTTTKKATGKKSSTTKKQSAVKTTGTGAAKPAQQPETKVVCPVCGTEFAIGEHEHTVKNATVLGMDSGAGTVYLPVSKRGEVLQAAGIDTSKYFSIQLPTGGEQIMKMGDDGKTAIPVTHDDPIIQIIIKAGTVPNRNLFRRWVMSQVFHGLTYDGCGGKGFTAWLQRHGYQYQWEMMIEELRVQARLHGRDWENYCARNRWFNKELALKMTADYIRQLRLDANGRPRHKCKGVPYITVDHTHYFLTDIEKKLINPLAKRYDTIALSQTPQELYEAVRSFWKNAPVTDWTYKQCAEWKDAYKGMGAFATMQNLLRFHGCHFPMDNDFYQRNKSDLQMLEKAAAAYADGEGWRLFGLLKQMLEENHFDIKKKQAEWRAAKQ